MRRALLKSAPLRPQPQQQLLLLRGAQRQQLSTRRRALGAHAPAAAAATHRHHQQQQHQPIIIPRRGLAASSPKPPTPTAATAAAAAAAASDAPPTVAPADAATDTATKRAGPEEEEEEGEEAAFPWRTAPHRANSFWELLARAFREFMPQAYLRGLFFNAVGNIMETPPEDVPELLFRCTRFAFIQAVRSIFEEAVTNAANATTLAAAAAPAPATTTTPPVAGKRRKWEGAKAAEGATVEPEPAPLAAATVQCLTPPPTWEYTREENVAKPTGEHELGVPPLAEMMDAQLAALYEGTVERLRARGRSVRLELHKVVPVSITDLQLVIGPPRGAPMPPGATKHNRLGVTVVASKPAGTPGEPEEGSGSGGSGSKGFGGNALGGGGGGGSGDWGQSFLAQIRPRLVPNYHYLFQMAVTFRCREVFAVTHAQTGALLQGWAEPRVVEHRVRFEVDLDKHAQLSRDWRIIDIDGWLDGNEYMAGVSNGGGDAAAAAGGAGAGAVEGERQEEERRGKGE